MIRVLHSVSNMDRAGIETMLMNYYRYIDKNKIQFDFLCNKKKPGDYDNEIKSMGGRIFHSPGLNPLKFFEYKKFMIELFKSNPEIKIMHSHNGELAYLSLYGAYKYGIKNRICHAHNTKIEQNLKKPLKLLYKTQLKKVANKYWGCGTDSVKFYFGKKVIEKNNFRIINNAIEINRFLYNEEKRHNLRQALNIEQKFVIGHVGRFAEQKNHTFILELFKVILNKNPNSILMLIGDGELKEKITQKARELDIDKSIMFMGNINDVNEMYQVMDVFILPSLFEGLPVVGIEAQTAGLKCYLSDTITREVAVTDNVKFLNLKNDSLETWAENILTDINYKRKDMSAEIIEAGYSIEEEAKKLEKIYMTMVGEKNDNI